jgi:hypothetical protein
MGIKNKGFDDAVKNGSTIHNHSEEKSEEFVAEAVLNAERNKNLPKALDEAAFHGVTGAIVRLFDPETEADPVAVLLQFLIAFGNLIGREPHYKIGGGRHAGNLFLVCVGVTGGGRKGTAWSCVKFLMRKVAETWCKTRIESGSSSGEGWIWAVRDEIRKYKSVRQKDGAMVTEEVLEDPGIEDKRLLLVEEEFAMLLKVMSREGNTLSSVVRLAWDGNDLKTLTKNSPARATEPHVSFVGHITKDELQKYITETEAANGFGNRFLWACVKRSKMLPDGGNLQGVDFSGVLSDLTKAIEFSQSVGQVDRDLESNAIWHAVYPELSKERAGLMGAMLGRSAPIVLRLALLYAILDCSSVIKAPHLKAALAVMDYCDESCRYIFGESLGDSIADEILQALKSATAGMTKTEIQALFNRNVLATKINSALMLLQSSGKARCEKESQGQGRPIERWFAK